MQVVVVEIAGQGEDGRPVSRRRLSRARDPRPCQRPAGQGGLGEARRGLRHDLRDGRAGAPGAGAESRRRWKARTG